MPGQAHLTGTSQWDLHPCQHKPRMPACRDVESGGAALQDQEQEQHAQHNVQQQQPREPPRLRRTSASMLVREHQLMATHYHVVPGSMGVRGHTMEMDKCDLKGHVLVSHTSHLRIQAAPGTATYSTHVLAYIVAINLLRTLAGAPPRCTSQGLLTWKAHLSACLECSWLATQPLPPPPLPAAPLPPATPPPSLLLLPAAGAGWRQLA
jgi:hypothetical protein